MNTLTSPTGLIHSLLLDGTGGARALTWQEVTDWSAEQGCLWLHFNFEDEEVQHWLSRESRLNDIAYNGLTALETRPRAVSRGGNLLLALRGINLTPGAQPRT